MYAEFEAPDKEKILHGLAIAVVRPVIYDNKAHRTSGVTADTSFRLASQPFTLCAGGALAPCSSPLGDHRAHGR
jgi:hypothetical protein